ncbi:MAG: hypothetical protein ACYC35_02315 [Pirellulales bacterium]|jgi:hypothetical protein
MNREETNAGVRYERKDIRLRWLLLLLVVATFFTAMVFYAAWRILWWEEAAKEAADEPTSRWAPGLSDKLPPEPRLEQLERMPGAKPGPSKSLAEQETALHRYGSTAEEGFVHIPIDQAMKAVAGKLPAGKSRPETATAGGLMEAGESNSGRVLRGPSP